MDGHTNSEQIDDVNVLVSELQARVSMLERENQQVKEHTKKQSREIQIMKQQKEGIEIREGDVESLKEVCRGLEEGSESLTKQLKKKNQRISYLEACAEDSTYYEKTAEETFRDMAAKETILMDEIKKLKSENSNLKTQLETEQAKSMTYKLDFDDERKDREKAHSRYADLEKEIAELKNVTRALASTDVTRDIELADVLKPSSLGGGDERDRELEEWRKEALQSRDELQAKTSQVKAYKKQVDEYKEKLEHAEKQSSEALLEQVTNLTLEKEHLEAHNSELAERVELLNVKIDSLVPLLRTELEASLEKKVTGEVDPSHQKNPGNDNDNNAPPLRDRDPSAVSPHPPNYFPPQDAINPPPVLYAPPHSDRDLRTDQLHHPPLTFVPTIPSREYNDQVYSDGPSTRSDNPTDYSNTVHRMHPQPNQNSQYYYLPQNQPPPLPSNYGNQQSYPIQQQFEPPFRSNPVQPLQQRNYDGHLNQPHSQPNHQQQYYPHDQYSELEKPYPQLAGNFETNSQGQNQPSPQNSISHNDKLKSNPTPFHNVQQSDAISINQPSPQETVTPPHSIPSQASQTSGSHISNPEAQEQLNPNRTELLVKPNVLQEGINGEISEAAAAVSQVTREEGEREGAPLDPNLICPMCMKQYRIGEIQLYRAHVNKCDGTRQ